MISKLCTYGRTRDEAIQRMLRALQEYTVEGIITNIPFHRWALTHPRFVSGDLDTGFIPQEYGGLPEEEDHLRHEIILATSPNRSPARREALATSRPGAPQAGAKASVSERKAPPKQGLHLYGL